MDETQVAQAIAAGELTSPQQFANSWFFALRISGTGTAFRKALDEYVYRRPENYLTPEFLARCNGLPVIIEHPAKQMLDSKEFAERIIGMIVLPYIGAEGIIDPEGDEVWGIARVLDQEAAQYLCENVASTSPAVVFSAASENEKVKLSDGKHLLIEGKPSLLDHLAVAALGVWDKGGPPAGVESTTAKELVMADEEKKVEEEKRDDADEKLDKMLSKLDSMHTRMDGIEARQARHDAEEAEEREREEKERHDAEEAEEEERQAALLEKLAAEEREEGEEAEARGDAGGKPWMARKDGESVTEHSNRVHGAAARCDAASFCRKDGESHAEHSARCDAMAKKVGRKDAEEEKEVDPEKGKPVEPERSDKAAKKDSEEEEDPEVKKNEEEAARKDAEIRAIKDTAEKQAAELSDLKRKVADRPDDEEAAFADAQSAADEVYQALGKRAPRPMAGERLLSYRIRMARELQPHSEMWKDSDLPAIARADAKGAFPNAERLIYADAMTHARLPSSIPEGTLRQVTRRDRTTGRLMHEFVGDPLSWMSQFMPPAAGATRIGRPKE